MPLDVHNGSTWVPAKDVAVYNGASYVQAKKVKVSNGAGGWTLAWVPKVPVVTVSFSKNGVLVNEAYDVYASLSIPAPEGTVVTFAVGAYSQPVAAAEGATVVTLPGASHGAAGSHAWTVTVTNLGGTTVGSATQSATDPVPIPPAEVVLNGGHCHNIQAAMNSAASQGVPLRLTGTFYCYTHVYIPDNLYITATGAMFYLNSTSANEGATFDAGRWKNNEKGNAPEYGQAGGFTIDGGTFDGNGEGCMTFSHSPGFVIKNATFYRYCSANNTGHAIETNSSGGPDNVSGPYTVQILNNSFLGTDRGQRSNTNDEPCHYDWNWTGSGGSLPNWSPGDPVSQSTQVMCHNVLIQNNTFHRRSESGGWQFALCGIGGHDSSDAAVRPSYRHNHFLINGNALHGATGGTGTNPNKGAIHLFRGRQMVANNNALYGGVTKRYITAEDTGDVPYCSAAGNTSASPTLSNPNSIVVDN